MTAILLNPFLLTYVLVLLTLWAIWNNPNGRWRRRLLVAALVVLTLTVTPAVSFLALGSLEWAYPPLDKRPPESEAIVVLGGFVLPPNKYHEETLLGWDSLYRCEYTRQLYAEGPPCPVIVCGGKVNPKKPGATISAAMKQFLQTRGVAGQDIIVEEKSTSTHENAVEVARLLEKHNIRRILLVTDGAHLPRAVPCFRKLGIDVIPAGTNYRTGEFEWSPASFLPNALSAVDVQYVVHEWVGMLWYRLKGRI